jgi:hypothetical protein
VQMGRTPAELQVWLCRESFDHWRYVDEIS